VAAVGVRVVRLLANDLQDADVRDTCSLANVTKADAELNCITDCVVPLGIRIACAFVAADPLACSLLDSAERETMACSPEVVAGRTLSVVYGGDHLAPLVGLHGKEAYHIPPESKA
jgi:hypothetical protein